MSNGIDHLILHSPYCEPDAHWEPNPETAKFEKLSGRRPAGYMKFNTKARSAGTFVELLAVNEIRKRVAAWRAEGYPNATRVTRQLLQQWKEVSEPKPFFCQLEAIETLIWFVEAPDAARQGLERYGLEGDGGPFLRRCTKLCTGGGKTTVMAMLIAWHVCNKVAQPQNRNYARDILIMAPNLTVRDRLAGLDPKAQENEYDRFGLVPVELADHLQRARVCIRNWQAITWESEEKIASRKSVDKRGAMSDTAYARMVLGPEMCHAPQLLVLNDEAHHAWRLSAGVDAKDYAVDKEAKNEATMWIGGLDRLHKAIGILCCHDFSATPFVPSGKMGKDDLLFKWIVSDFGLNDGIESGLVKTPQMALNANALIDAETLRPVLYDLYEAKGVKESIGKNEPPTAPLHSTLVNAYALLAADWKKTADIWAERGAPTPPVLISVVNSTATAARIEHHFKSQHPSLQAAAQLCEAERLLRIDSEAIENASVKESGAKKEAADSLREKSNTVGKVGKAGEHICNLVSVAMLSEGWDAKTVTHILGLRAFTSQLLCEQVIGRGLRRTNYDIHPETGLLEPQYVQVFGVPFRFLPTEDRDDGGGEPPKPTFPVYVAEGRERAEIRWPNIVRFDQVASPELSLEGVPPLTLRLQHITLTEMAQTLGGWFQMEHTQLISLLEHAPRIQTLIFHITKALVESSIFADKFRQFTKPRLFAQVAHLVEAFIHSDRCQWDADLFWDIKHCEDCEARIAYTFAIGSIITHLLAHLTPREKQCYETILDAHCPVLSTARMRLWYTTKERFVTNERSQISHAVYDSTWEQEVALALQINPFVEAYVRNDRHVGMKVRYLWQGNTKQYLPDFIIRLTNGITLVLEVKGQPSGETQTKHNALIHWCHATTQLGTYGTWAAVEIYNPQAINEVLERYSTTPLSTLA